MPDLTPEQIAASRKKYEPVSGPQWRSRLGTPGYEVATNNFQGVVALCPFANARFISEFICDAHATLPAALDTIDSLRQRVAELEKERTARDNRTRSLCESIVKLQETVDAQRLIVDAMLLFLPISPPKE